MLAKNIRFLRKEKSMSQDTLAEILNYKSYTTIQKWEMGTSEPPLKIVGKLAEMFNVDIDELTNSDLSNPMSKDTSRGTWINVYGRVAAGLPLEAIEDIIDTEEISTEMARSGEHFGLQIKGDSMEPKISEGDNVIVRKQDDAESGDTVIALVNGHDAFCKRLMKYESGISLISTNPIYEPKHYTNEEIEKLPVNILGKVVELRAKF
jgi:SOS-response transcriptional repressors (RecA-mediated autopeptidases)